MCDVAYVLLLEHAERSAGGPFAAPSDVAEQVRALDEWLTAEPLQETDPEMAELKSALGVQ